MNHLEHAFTRRELVRLGVAARLAALWILHGL